MKLTDDVDTEVNLNNTLRKHIIGSIIHFGDILELHHAESGHFVSGTTLLVTSRAVG